MHETFGRHNIDARLVELPLFALCVELDPDFSHVKTLLHAFVPLQEVLRSHKIGQVFWLYFTAQINSFDSGFANNCFCNDSQNALWSLLVVVDRRYYPSNWLVTSRRAA